MCVCESGDKKEREKYRKYFLFRSYDKLYIYIHTLQHQCNLSLICNKKYKEGNGHDSIWDQITAN